MFLNYDESRASLPKAIRFRLDRKMTLGSGRLIVSQPRWDEAKREVGRLLPSVSAGTRLRQLRERLCKHAYMRGCCGGAAGFF